MATYAQEENARPSPIRLCFVEDNQTDVFVFNKLLNKLNAQAEKNKASHIYTPTVINTYDDALKEMKKNDHDIYFIDFSLDKHTGLDLIQTAHHIGCHGPFIILTHHDHKDYYEASAALGIYDYIIKTELSPSVIDRTITYALNRKKIENALMLEKRCFNHVISKIPYAIVQIDTDFNIQRLNNAAPHILGYLDKDLEGANIFDFFKSHDKKAIIDNFFDPNIELISFRSLWRTESGEERTIFWDCVRRYQGLDTPRGGGFVFIGKDMTQDIRIDYDESDEEGDSLDSSAEGFGNLV